MGNFISNKMSLIAHLYDHWGPSYGDFCDSQGIGRNTAAMFKDGRRFGTKLPIWNVQGLFLDTWDNTLTENHGEI